jgi:hypothetical protein
MCAQIYEWNEPGHKDGKRIIISTARHVLLYFCSCYNHSAPFLSTHALLSMRVALRMV